MRQSGPSKLAFVLIPALPPLRRAVLPQQTPSPLVQGVGPIEITVSDADQALRFYSEVLSFEKISDQTVHDTHYLRLEGASASVARVVQMRLGDEYRPYPIHEHWAQSVIDSRIEDTINAWRRWSSLHQNYQGPWQELVLQSGRICRA